MSDDKNIENIEVVDELQTRRDFLVGLQKWSKAVIGGVVLGSVLLQPADEAHGWRARRGYRTWANRPGARWANRGRAWANRGVAWANRVWANGGSVWSNGGSTWINHY